MWLEISFGILTSTIKDAKERTKTRSAFCVLCNLSLEIMGTIISKDIIKSI